VPHLQGTQRAGRPFRLVPPDPGVLQCRAWKKGRSEPASPPPAPPPTWESLALIARVRMCSASSMEHAEPNVCEKPSWSGSGNRVIGGVGGRRRGGEGEGGHLLQLGVPWPINHARERATHSPVTRATTLGDLASKSMKNSSAGRNRGRGVTDQKKLSQTATPF
jgi:hypothetical protein